MWKIVCTLYILNEKNCEQTLNEKWILQWKQISSKLLDKKFSSEESKREM